MAINFESGQEGEQEYVDIEEEKERRESREKELSLAKRVRAMKEDPVVKKMLEQGRGIDCSYRLKHADEQREEGEIFQEGMEKVHITAEKDPWEHTGDVVETRQLYVIREGKEGSDYAYFSLGMDERAAEIRHLLGETIGVLYAEGKKRDGKITISKGLLDQLVSEYNMRAEDDRRKLEEKRIKEGARDINFQS